jgi:hypothetical protein
MTKPEGYKSHQIYLSDEVDRQLKMIAPYGSWDTILAEIATEGIEARWKEFVEREHAKLNQSTQDSKTARKSSAHGARKA